MAILSKHERILETIDRRMINNGILEIPDGIAYVGGILDLCLTAANITAEIKVVVFPKSLKRIDSFLYNNKTVKLVVFNSPVVLSDRYNQGAFENSAVEEIIIPYGFSGLPTVYLANQCIVVDNSDSLYQEHLYNTDSTFCLSFYRSTLKSLTVAEPDKKYISKIASSRLFGYYAKTLSESIKKKLLDDDITTKSWDQISYLFYTKAKFIILEKPIPTYSIAMELWDCKVAEAINRYIPNRQKKISKKAPNF